jgi:Domain of unknown function (DUF5664)
MTETAYGNLCMICHETCNFGPCRFEDSPSHQSVIRTLREAEDHKMPEPTHGISAGESTERKGSIPVCDNSDGMRRNAVPEGPLSPSDVTLLAEKAERDKKLDRIWLVAIEGEDRTRKYLTQAGRHVSNPTEATLYTYSEAIKFWKIDRSDLCVVTIEDALKRYTTGAGFFDDAQSAKASCKMVNENPDIVANLVRDGLVIGRIPPTASVQEEGIKTDEGKTKWQLVPWDALKETANVMTVCAAPIGKYPERNWEKGLHYSRLFRAAIEHLTTWFNGEEKDPETGLSHLAHAACCVLFLLAYTLRAKLSGSKIAQFDDRPKGNAS